MTHPHRTIPAFALILLAALSCGCQPKDEPTTAPDTTVSQDDATTGVQTTDMMDGEATGEAEPDSEVAQAMATLSPADRQLAEAQKICPVSDHPLGGMGTPVKVSVEGRDVFVCCDACVDELKTNFDKYAAKLEN